MLLTSLWKRICILLWYMNYTSLMSHGYCPTQITTKSHTTTQLHSHHSPSSIESISRRDILQKITTTAATSFIPFVASSPKLANAEDVSSELQNGLLEVRVLENVLSSPPYGIESSDVLYPSYFNGVWNVQSKTTEVLAPCGITLFGGNSTFTKAQNEIGTTLLYKARFIPSAYSSSKNSNNDGSDETTSQPMVIADREYNVIEIVKSAMGSNSVLDVPLSTPNKVSVLLSPNGANQVFRADLLTLNRRSEYINSCEFHCSEVVRQIISPANSNQASTNAISPQRSTSLFKEIETTSLYTVVRNEKDGSVNSIFCRQRSATFLLPSQQDPLALKMWEMSRGRPIDVRFYDVSYTQKI